MCCKSKSKLLTFHLLLRSSLFPKDEAVNDQESPMSTVKPASVQRDTAENDEEHLFDLDWQKKERKEKQKEFQFEKK